jgi:hypothetical protein
MLTWPYTSTSGQITLLDSSPDWSSTYPTLHGLTWLNYLTRSFPDQTSAYPIIPGLIQSYLALQGLTRPNYLTRLGNTLLHPTIYPALTNHLTQPSTLQLALPKNFLIGLPP